MSDPLWVVVWCAVLVAGVGACVGLHRLGLASTHVRDLLHVGSGVWVLGWPLWHDATAPVCLATLVATATALVPLGARRSVRVRRFAAVFATGDETFIGLVLYGVAFAVLTAIAFRVGFFPAAAGLLALALGDGIGGAVGLAAGRHHYRAPLGKQKSLEGSLAVALASGVGMAVAGLRFGVELGVGTIAGLGAVASIVEAVAPRSTDNLLVPAAVWALTQGLST
jgi:dolichol kinase